MKTIITLLALSAQAFAGDLVPSSPKTEWRSVYTDLNSDCVVISVATEEAPIDFYQAECKSFGGFQLFIEGGDLRYGPELRFGKTGIDLERPMSFHDMGSDKVEWVYHSTIDNEGVGSIEWKGLIYRLSEASEDGERDVSILYAVRLSGEKSCVLGKVLTNEAARELVYSDKTCH